MKQQSQPDRGVRKSNRQRVPNAFYTEGINELKRAPRPARDPPKPPRKRSNVYQEEPQSEPIEPQEEDKSEVIKDAPDWLPCKLPKNGAMIKIQFIVQQPEEPPAPAPKQQAPKPPAKKPDSAFDLLSLFQKAIENVKDEDIPAEKSAQVEPQPIAKEPKLKKEASLAKPRRQEDSEGRITRVTLQGDKMIILHSKIGETEFPLMGTQMDVEEAPDAAQEMKEEEMDEEKAFREDVEEYRRRIEAAGVLGQISIFN